MSQDINYDMEAIRAFWMELERFANEVAELRSQFDGAVSAAEAEWKDSQFKTAAEKALDASNGVSMALQTLYQDVEDFLRRQEDFHFEYTAR